MFSDTSLPLGAEPGPELKSSETNEHEEVTSIEHSEKCVLISGSQKAAAKETEP